jgi:predicted nucleic acid-binding protein
LIVVDASVLADFLLGRHQTVSALALETESREHEPLHAPDLVEPETLNALRGLARGGAISEHRALEAVGDLGKTRLIRYPHAPLRDRIWALRHNLTAYDAAYLALAEALDDPVLMTGDEALAHVARHSLGPDHVRHVE